MTKLWEKAAKVGLCAVLATGMAPLPAYADETPDDTPGASIDVSADVAAEDAAEAEGAEKVNLVESSTVEGKNVQTETSEVAAETDVSAFSYSLVDGEAAVTGYTGSDTEVTIPSEIDGYAVTSIGEGAFAGCSMVESFDIPEGVASIRPGAFYRCGSLAEIFIPASVSSIAQNAFDQCGSLASFAVSEANEYYYSDSGVLFSKEKSALENYPEGKKDRIYAIPEGTLSIAQRAFSGASVLAIDIPSSVTSIGQYAFTNVVPCIILAPSEDLYNLLVGDKYSYYNNGYCTIALKSVGQPSSDFEYVVQSGVASITGYKGADIDVVIPSEIDGYKVTSIGEAAFARSDISSATIPDAVTSVGAAAFLGCSSLKEVTVSSGVTTIGAWAFAECSSLSSVDVPEGVETFGDCAFYGLASPSVITVSTQEQHELLISNPLPSKGFINADRTSVKLRDSEPVLTEGWNQLGTCEWLIDENGILTIRPLSNGESGIIDGLPGYASSPWYKDRASIKSVVFENGVKASGSLVSMFHGCSALKSIDFADFDTAAVTNMSHMFNGCEVLTSLDLSGFDTANVADMSWMFYNCEVLESLDLSKFDTSCVTNMKAMFRNCAVLPSIDLSDFDTSKVSDMGWMFAGCSSLAELDFANFDTSNVTNMSCMFNGCSSIASLDVSSFDTAAVKDMSSMFKSCLVLDEISGLDFNTSSVTDMADMFNLCSKLKKLDLSSFDTSNVSDMSGMFCYCRSLDSLDLSGFDTAKVADMHYMFNSCQSLTSLDVSSFDMSNVASVDMMFYDCRALTSLDLSCSGTSALTDAGWAFANCLKLASLDLTGWDFSSVNYMVNTFHSCSSLSELVIECMDTSNVTNMRNAFYECASLKKLPAGISLASVADGNAKQCFYVNSDEPLATEYAGNDESVLNYDWASDNRKLVVIEYTAKGYVKRLYADILGNDEPTDYQLEYWAGRIESGRPVASVVRGFLESDAFASKGHSDAEKVAVLYGAMLGNCSPSDYQVSYWTDKMEAGWTLSQVVYGFSRSEAFLAQVDLYGLAPGQLDAEDYVLRLYNDILNIDEPSAYQLSYWAGKITSGTPVAEVVSGFLASDAFKTIGYSDEQKVAVLYGAMLGNYEPTEYQISYWAGRFASGTTEYDVCAGFAASAAFSEQAKLYGLTV